MGKASTGSGFAQRLERLGTVADLVCVDAPHAQGGGFSWWYLPAGERSFTTPVFKGWDETVSYVQKAWTEQGPFDGILGFSQGAILIAALVAVGVVRANRRVSSDSNATQINPKYLVLAGSAVPGPFRKELEALTASSDVEGGAVHTLHVIGS